MDMTEFCSLISLLCTDLLVKIHRFLKSFWKIQFHRNEKNENMQCVNKEQCNTDMAWKIQFIQWGEKYLVSYYVNNTQKISVRRENT